MNKRKVPKIRFKGFHDDWEQRKFSDVVEICSGMDYKQLGEGDIPVYGTGGYMLSVDSALSEEKDAIGIGRKGTIDNPYILRAPFWTVDTLFYCIPKENYDLDFTNCLFQTVDWKKKDESTGVPSLSKVIINNVEAVVPTFDEQKKIGEYFNSLDNLITLHQRKLEKLKIIKKSMLENCFPKNGAKVPKTRFSGFSDDWEQRKFKELCDMVTVGIANSATQAYSDSGVPMLRNQNIKPNFLDDADIIYIKPEFEVQYKNKRLKINDLLVVRTGYPGTACVVTRKYENSQTFTTLIARPKKSVNSYLLCQYLNSDVGVKYFESTQIGGGQKNSGAGILNEMPVTLPQNINEAKEIADYFADLDHLITLHQSKLEKLKMIKKSMLETMFV